MPLSSPDGPRRSSARSVRVLIADDHRTFAEALRTAMRLERGLSVVGVVHDGESAVTAARKKVPDVVLMDVQMPRLDGIAATRRIKEEHPETRVVMLSAFEDEHNVARAIDAGAEGFVSKNRPVKEVARSIRAAHRGEALMDPEETKRVLAYLRRRRAHDAAEASRVERLTRRETEILQGLADGRGSEQLAERLGISRHTLRTHVQNILFKLKVHSKLEAVAVAIRHGKVHTDKPVTL